MDSYEIEDRGDMENIGVFFVFRADSGCRFHIPWTGADTINSAFTGYFKGGTNTVPYGVSAQ